MKKKSTKKIALCRETLQYLEAERTGKAAGGSWWSCPQSCIQECYFSEPMNEGNC